ncbi:MAG: membrane protein insertion efficiency factor YidD [Bacteroidetes bacterium]|nr:membrane protein insertion efficiency factor YidD [Bacteroidota bacterium]
MLLQVFALLSVAQTKSDWGIALSKEFPDSRFNERKVSYLFADKKNVFVKYNPVSLFFGGSLFVYQKYISKQLGADCPYEISCSSFSRQVIRTYGLLKGIPLTADRLTRCTAMAKRDFNYYHLRETSNRIIDSVETYQHLHY